LARQEKHVENIRRKEMPSIGLRIFGYAAIAATGATALLTAITVVVILIKYVWFGGN
jgi:hypothetical protein